MCETERLIMVIIMITTTKKSALINPHPRGSSKKNAVSIQKYWKAVWSDLLLYYGNLEDEAVSDRNCIELITI